MFLKMIKLKNLSRIRKLSELIFKILVLKFIIAVIIVIIDLNKKLFKL